MGLTANTAQDIIILSMASPKDNLSNIISRMPHNTIFVVAGLFYGRNNGILEFDFDKDTLTVLDKTIYRDRFDESIVTLADTIVEVVKGYAKDETDVTFSHIQQWAGLTPDNWQIVYAYIVNFVPELTFYTVKDGKAEHKFITLLDNVEHRWGEKLQKK